MTLTTRQEGPALVVKLAGSIELEEADALQSELPALVGGPTPHLVFDLSELEFVSSLGLSAIVATHRQARESGGSVRIVNPKPNIHNLLRLTRVSELITVYPTLAAAKADLANVRM